MAKINSESEKDFLRNMELRAELSRMSYEATGGVRENYRNNENPNVNLGGQEALQQFKKINPLTTEMIREYKEEEIDKYKGDKYIKPDVPIIIPPPYTQINGSVPTENDLVDINKEIDKLSNEVVELLDYKTKTENELSKYVSSIFFVTALVKSDRQNINIFNTNIRIANEMIDEKREEIKRLENLKIGVSNVIEENKKIQQIADQENKKIIYKYEEDLKQANMNRLNVNKQPNETEYQYFERLKTIAETKSDEAFYKDKAQLEQIKKLKDNIRKLIRNESMVEGVVKKLMEEETVSIFEVNKYFTLIEEEFLKVFGYNNKNLDIRDIVASINTILSKMGEVAIVEEPNIGANIPKQLVKDNIYAEVSSNHLVISVKRPDGTFESIGLFPATNTNETRYWVEADKGNTEDPSNYEKISVSSISRHLGIPNTDLNDIFTSTNKENLAKELMSKYKLTPKREERRAVGRPSAKQSLLSSAEVQQAPPFPLAQVQQAPPIPPITLVQAPPVRLQGKTYKSSATQSSVPYSTMGTQASVPYSSTETQTASQYPDLYKRIDAAERIRAVMKREEIQNLYNQGVMGIREQERAKQTPQLPSMELSPLKTLDPMFKGDEYQQEFDYRGSPYEEKISTKLRNAINRASDTFAKLGNTQINLDFKATALRAIGDLLKIPEDSVNFNKQTIKKYIDNASEAVSKAHEDKQYYSIVEANKAIEELRDAIIGKVRKGSGMKRKPTKATKATKAVSQADKLRINLIIGEIKAGNNNPMLLKEINKIKKKYSK